MYNREKSIALSAHAELLSADGEFTNLYFRTDWADYKPLMDYTRFEKNIHMKLVVCKSWEALGPLMWLEPHQLIIHINTLKRRDVTIPEIISMLKVRFKLAGINIPIGISIEPDTPLATIKELKQTEIFGIVPSAQHWGVDECITAIHKIRDRISYWPNHIISSLPGNKPKRVSKQKNEITISPRQQQVLDLIKTRGLSNKQIAKALSISEATVKMHVGDIMRAYAVKSRVQLAVLA